MYYALTKDGGKWLVNLISATEAETKFIFTLHTIIRKEDVELALKMDIPSPVDLTPYELKSEIENKLNKYYKKVGVDTFIATLLGEIINSETEHAELADRVDKLETENEFLGVFRIKKQLYYTYESGHGFMHLYTNFAGSFTTAEWLCVIVFPEKINYLRIDNNTNTCYYNDSCQNTNAVNIDSKNIYNIYYQ